jgi:UDP-galactose transporter B1
MTASNEALTYVSYPTAVLAKSSKLIPTMLVGFFLERKSFFIQEWCSAALITAGITIFNLSRLSTHEAVAGEEEDSDSVFGIFLLIFSLGMDGLLASFQGRLKKNNKNGKYRLPSALDCMFWVNAYAIIFMLPLSIWTGQFSNGIKLFRNSQITPPMEPQKTVGRVILNLFRRRKRDRITIATPNESLALAWTILCLNMTAAAGQIFIFFTIQLFSPLMCTTITTTRKFFTILLSVFNFGHHFTRVQWSAIVMVFGGLYLAIVSKVSNTKNTIKIKVNHKED